MSDNTYMDIKQMYTIYLGMFGNYMYRTYKFYYVTTMFPQTEAQTSNCDYTNFFITKIFSFLKQCPKIIYLNRINHEICCKIRSV